MKFLFYSLCVCALFVASCGNSEAQLELREQIEVKEDSITKLSQNLAMGEVLPPSVSMELIVLMDNYANAYPEDEFSPEYLDKIHMIYSARGEYDKSAAYGSKIITNYPKYVNRAMILESQASAYDIYIQPRDTSKVRYYYQLLLSEYPDLPEEKRMGIQDRLNNLDMTIEEIILQNN